MTTAPIPEWDEPDAEWVASLRDDDPPAPDDGGPHTTSELVLVPGYTQSAWDRHQVQILSLAHDGETYLWGNQHKPGSVLVRDMLLGLGRPRAAAAFMSPGGPLTVTPDDQGTIYEAMITARTAAAKPKRKRPSQARKTVTGTSRDPR